MSRLIHKYSNRRLYDKHRGRAITLLDLADIVLDGESVRVEHRATREDITTVTLLHALVERLKRHPGDDAAGRIADGLMATLRNERALELAPAGDVEDLEKAGVGVA
ncbi:polyhydroxyalkanoate synthesis regulator DNA-binding domain-containing protein [bacterium]|nr:polyhydroxyalkanoate synthesis regulator DNA-binding domain-containing protein [bacterium]